MYTVILHPFRVDQTHVEAYARQLELISDVHKLQRHPATFVIQSASSGSLFCLACALELLQDPEQSIIKKKGVIIEMTQVGVLKDQSRIIV